MAGILNLEQPTHGKSAPKRTGTRRLWMIFLIASLAGNAFQLLAGWNARQHETAMQSAIGQAVDVINSHVETDLRWANALNAGCPQEIPATTTAAAAYNLRFSIPCRAPAAMTPLGAALLVHVRRMLVVSLHGEKIADDLTQDSAHVYHLQRALDASTSGKTSKLDEVERKLLKEIEHSSADNLK
jgi:hypothetical protein